MKRRIEDVEKPSKNTFSPTLIVIDEDTEEEIKDVTYANEVTGKVVRYKRPLNIIEGEHIETIEEIRNIRIER